MENSIVIFPFPFLSIIETFVPTALLSPSSRSRICGDLISLGVSLVPIGDFAGSAMVLPPEMICSTSRTERSSFAILSLRDICFVGFFRNKGIACNRKKC